MSTHKKHLAKKVHLFSRSGEQICKQLNISPMRYVNSSILDCASGASSLVTYLRGFDINVKAIDPIYAHEPNRIFNDVSYDRDMLKRQLLNENPKYHAEIEQTFKYGYQHLQHFIDDICNHTVDYINGAFPILPFEDSSFDAIFTSNFLFTYSSNDTGGMLNSCNSLNLSFHEKSFDELLRVSKKEIRIFPVDQIDSLEYEIHPYLKNILESHSHKIDWNFSLSPSFASHKPKRVLLTAFHKELNN